jgi:hypothetical protein
MRRRLLAALSSAAAVCLSSVALSTSADAAPSHSSSWHRNDHVCTAASPGYAACSAIRHDTTDSAAGPVNTPAEARSDAGAKPNVTPSGKSPADIRSAYGLGSSSSGGRTVAIVDAYDDPNAEKDLAVYRSQYHLGDCTTANKCFTKVSQTGSTTKLPPRNGGWAQEISLDLDMVSATCPDCHILLVEASSASFANLSAAVGYAAEQPGVVAISNSYGGPDTTSYASAYNHPGIAVTASTGDSGYGIQSPASFPGVVAVGGTSLNKASNARGWTESAWSGAGSGCSTLNPKPTYQTGVTGCTGKATADVSAVADPNTGVAVYDSYAYQGYSGWMVFGGTSAASPIIASVYALAGGPGAGVDAGSTIWGNTDASALNEVSDGSNGPCPSTVPQLCTAGSGWDGPTGLGTPNGTTAFSNPS